MPFKDKQKRAAWQRQYDAARKKPRPSLPERACLNCVTSFIPKRRDALFCSVRCRLIGAWVRYTRRKLADGTIGDPEVWEAISSRLGALIAGSYDKRGDRAVSAETRMELRSLGRCQKCGWTFSEDGDGRFTVQHSRTDHGFLLEAWCYRCNMDHAQSVVVPLTDDEAWFVQSLFERVRAPEPLRICDDEIEWSAKWRSYAGKGLARGPASC